MITLDYDAIMKDMPMTNEEYIHSLNTEQLAEWIEKMIDCDYCPAKKLCEKQLCKKQPCKKQIEMWLKQPHTEKE